MFIQIYTILIQALILVKIGMMIEAEENIQLIFVKTITILLMSLPILFRILNMV